MSSLHLFYSPRPRSCTCPVSAAIHSRPSQSYLDSIWHPHPPQLAPTHPLSPSLPSAPSPAPLRLLPAVRSCAARQPVRPRRRPGGAGTCWAPAAPGAAAPRAPGPRSRPCTIAGSRGTAPRGPWRCPAAAPRSRRTPPARRWRRCRWSRTAGGRRPWSRPACPPPSCTRRCAAVPRLGRRQLGLRQHHRHLPELLHGEVERVLRLVREPALDVPVADVPDDKTWVARCGVSDTSPAAQPGRG